MENEIRVGLEPSSQRQVPHQTESARQDPLDQMSFGKPVRRHVRDFGLLFCLIGVAIGSWQIYRGRPAGTSSTWIAVGVAFGVLGLLAPRVLLPVWRAWMKFAHYLSLVMTGVLLTLTWCFGFLLISSILRIIGIRRIDMAYGDGRSTYWEKRDPKYDDFKRLELQY